MVEAVNMIVQDTDNMLYQDSDDDVSDGKLEVDLAPTGYPEGVKDLNLMLTMNKR